MQIFSYIQRKLWMFSLWKVQKIFYELAFLRLCINLTKMMTLQEGFLKLSWPNLTFSSSWLETLNILQNIWTERIKEWKKVRLLFPKLRLVNKKFVCKSSMILLAYFTNNVHCLNFAAGFSCPWRVSLKNGLELFLSS